MYKIVNKVCQAIWTVLQPLYLPEASPELWMQVAKDFYSKWQFPNCVGAIDGRHIQIQAPANSGSEFFNYKKYFSLVLMASCDASYKFTWVDIGQYGSMSDGGVWNNSTLADALEHEETKLPPLKMLPGSHIKFPHVFVADEAFPLKPYLMRPYPRAALQDKQRVFNYRLSRARRVIENTFGILKKIRRHLSIVLTAPLIMWTKKMKRGIQFLELGGLKKVKQGCIGLDESVPIIQLEHLLSSGIHFAITSFRKLVKKLLLGSINEHSVVLL
ncbi:uncharacterized protein [Temnothorax nylanderi]|uniref:uncharacterized protein n=1 Tax=Temnothorax nylanderi TaxID=102681 RepID=UPI003A83D083